MSRTTIFATGEFYHVYNRGTDKRKIFMSKIDYSRFIALLYLCNNTDRLTSTFRNGRGLTSPFEEERRETLVNVCAYCLMPNHFHLILHEKVEDGVSRFMHKLTTAYTMYFNTLHDRDGSLFQGTFKATHANNDQYLSYLIAYVHLNPIKLIDSHWKENGIKNRKRAEQFLDTYAYSSFPDYSGQDRMEKYILTSKILPQYTKTQDDFKKSVTQWLDYGKEGEA